MLPNAAAGLRWTVSPIGRCSVQTPLACRVAVPIERLVVGCDHHALGAEVIVKTFRAAFAPDAGIIDAAPGRCRIEAMMVVDPDDAGLDRGGQPMRAANVAGADRGSEPKGGVIGKPQGVRFILEWRHR